MYSNSTLSSVNYLFATNIIINILLLYIKFIKRRSLIRL